MLARSAAARSERSHRELPTCVLRDDDRDQRCRSNFRDPQRITLVSRMLTRHGGINQVTLQRSWTLATCPTAIGRAASEIQPGTSVS